MATETTAAPKEVVVESKSDIPNDTTKEIPVQKFTNHRRDIKRAEDKTKETKKSKITKS